MRANSPLPVNDMSVINVVEDVLPSERLSPEHVQLAKAAKAPAGKIILDHLQKRIDDYRNTLENANFANNDPAQTAVTVMTAQAVMREFRTVLQDVEISTQAVSDANNGR